MQGKKFIVTVDEKLCKGCENCVLACPKKVLELNSRQKAFGARPDDCIGCLRCEYVCPDFAVTVTEIKGEEA
ncbi:4Fe-4S binding protein [candidate division WOR-3 bacterium]|nr:4Fe-4S binding protein [candidate division WOR-3 bacterium]